jgi:thymidine kinase
MAKLYFYYSAMNAGKSAMLLQSSYNYEERGMKTLLFIPAIDKRYKEGEIHSRIGLKASAISFHADFNFYEYTREVIRHEASLRCILIDEAQFLTHKQTLELTNIVDHLNLPVLAYGIRSDFRGEPFEGSKYLLTLADNLVEIKTICFCGRKAIMNARMNAEGEIISKGNQIEIGGNDKYISMCRKHFFDALQRIEKKEAAFA